MKLSYFKAWALAAVLSVAQTALATQAIIDLDDDGLSDTWESQFGFNTDDSGYTPPEQAALADPDHDGRTNLEECAAGTDPWSGEQPGGFFQAEVGKSLIHANTFAVSWYGAEGKVYQLYSSPDLGANWIAQGEPVEGTGGKIDYNLPIEDVEAANRFFWRLKTIALDSDGDGVDDEADLYPLDRFNGARPLLLVAGEWKVKTTNASGAPVDGVEIEFRKWHSGTQGVEEEWLSSGATGMDGCVTFNPAELETGDRVVARLAGNAQQRVYLPWRPGSEIVDASPTPGGTGWSEEDLQDLLTDGGVDGGGIGQVPNLAGNPGNGAPVDEKDGQGGGTVGLLRLCDIVDAWHQMSHDRGWTVHTAHIASGADMSTLVVSSSPYPIEDPWFGSTDKDYYYGFRLSEGPYLYGVNSGGYYEHVGEVSLELTPRLVPESKIIPIQATFLNKIEFYDDGLNTPWSEVKPSMPLSLGGTQPIAIPQSLDPDKKEIVRLCGPDTSRSLHSNVVLGPVPAHVPKEVFLGGDFYFRNFTTLEVQAELPFGFPFKHVGPILDPTGYTKVNWTVEITEGTEFAKVKFKDAIDESAVFTAPSSGMTSTGWSTPAITIAFVAGEEPMEPGDTFKIHVQAAADGIPLGETSALGIPLGGFDMTFKFASDGTRGPEDAALEQVAELRGSLDDEGDVSAFESDPLRAGQRNQTLEEERKVGLSGLPAPGASTFVDALTLRFHHGEGDFHLPVPGSDLSLSVFRNSAESIWTKASGLRPNEDPLLPFGPGWSSNLAAASVWSHAVVEEIPPVGSVIGSIRITDYTGRSFFFNEIKQATQSIFVLDPSLLPDRGNAKVKLTKLVSGDFKLEQPLLGITHIFKSADLEFTLPNNRDLPEDSGATHSVYYRLDTVNDRYGNILQWSYDLNGSPAGKMIPDSIRVLGREALKLRFEQENGRVVAFWDPSGIKHTYHYVAEPTGSLLSVLGHHATGGRTTASYGYRFWREEDPRPIAMRLPLQSPPSPPGSPFYDVSTYHLTLNRIADGDEKETFIGLTPSSVRQAYSGRGNAFYHVAGDPMVVAYVVLPGQGALELPPEDGVDVPEHGRLVQFGGDHRLIPAHGGDPAVAKARTEVTDMWGHDWVYEWATPQEIRWRPAFSGLPAISGLFFPSLDRSCADVANSGVTFEYDLAAGFALKSVQDASGRKSEISHEIPSGANPGVWYSPPVEFLSTGGVAALSSRAMEPSKTKDVRGIETYFTYTANERLPETIKDHRGRVTSITYGIAGRPTSIKRWGHQTGEGDLEQLLSETTIDYHPDLTALAVKTTQETTGIFAEDDPEWVEPLNEIVEIDDANLGWPARSGRDGNGDGDLDDPEDLASEASFSASGRLLEMRSANGGSRSFAYDAAGLLDSICYEDGARVSFEYDEAGRLAVARDALGHASGTVYDELGRVVKTIRDVEGGGNLVFDTVNSSFDGVDDWHDLIQTVFYDDANSRVETTDPRGYIRVAEMDALRRVVKSITPRADRERGVVPDADDDDAVRSIYYSALHSPEDPSWTMDPMGYKTLYCYDNFGRLSDIRRQYGEESEVLLFQNTHYCYYPDGLPKSVTVMRTPVDAAGEIVGAEEEDDDEDGLTSEIHYDLLDRPQLLIAGKDSDKEIHSEFFYSSTGLPRQVQVRDGLANTDWQITSSVYDSLGRLTKRILPQVMDATTDGVETPEFETIYGPDGSVQSISDAYGNLTSFLYDVLGNSSQTLGPQVRDVRSGLNTRPATSTRYDAAGRTLAVTDPLARTWEYRWDAASRMRASLGPLMNPGEEDENRRRAVTTYNPSLTGDDQVIDAEGHSTFITYDATGQVRQTRSPVHSFDPTGSSTEEDLVETITRDLMGRVESTEDGEGHLTRFAYDGFGRTTSRTWDPGEPARQKTESVFYDALLRTGRQDANGQVTSFTYYPESSRLWKVSPAGKPAEELTFDWDDLGRLKSVDAADSASGMGNADCSYTYDAMGRLESEISNGKTTSYGYDLNGLPAEINYDNDRELRMVRDAAGRVTSLQDTLASFTRTTGFGYDVGGRLLREDLDNELVETSSYDRMGRLTGKQLRTADWNVLCGSRYTYDFNSNVTSLREVTGPLSVPSRTVTMEYDERGRLLREEQTGAVNRVERHGYDLADNRTWSRKSEGGVNTARDYEYGTVANGYNSNQLAGFEEKIGAASLVTTSYLYDDNGNRTQRSRGGQSDTYAYDSFDRLVELTLGTAGPDNGTYRYAYDHASRRIAREVPGGGKRNFAFAVSSPVLEWTDGGPLTENIGGGVGGRLYSYEGGTPAWDFHDARGDLLGQTSSGGGLFYRALNDASGRTVADDGDRRGGYGANSKWEEPGGLVNDGFRYRDLDVGLFINRDPAGFIDGLNVYNYVGHNPWTMYDPFGLSESDGDGVTAPENGGGYAQSEYTTRSHLIQMDPNRSFGMSMLAAGYGILGASSDAATGLFYAFRDGIPNGFAKTAQEYKEAEASGTGDPVQIVIGRTVIFGGQAFYGLPTLIANVDRVPSGIAALPEKFATDIAEFPLDAPVSGTLNLLEDGFIVYGGVKTVTAGVQSAQRLVSSGAPRVAPYFNLANYELVTYGERMGGAFGVPSKLPLKYVGPAAKSEIPTLPKFDGETTQGILIANEGPIVSLESGKTNPIYGNYAAAGHVEGKAAIWMRENGSSGGTVYHNNPNGTCGFCNSQVETLLPEGANMQVVPPEGASPNNSWARGGPTSYTGNGNAPKPNSKLR